MPLDKVVWTCLALLLFSSAGSWGCLQHCNQTQFVIPNQTKEIVLPGCSKQCTKQCTKNCTHCSLQNQEIVQAWWYYYNPDGTPIPNQNGFANRSSNYSINVTRWWGESGDHYIIASYKYLCKHKRKRNGWAVHNIEIKLRVLDVNINCTDEMPVKEGTTVNLQCLAGLPQTLDLKEEFYFNDQNWTCDSYSNARERSSKRKHAYRNQEQNYNCELEISNAQTSDSGCYKCSVSVPGHDSPVMSRELCFQVQSAGLSTSEIIAYALGAVLLALILVLAVTIGVYAVYKRAHRGDPEEIQPLVGNNQAGQHPQPQAGQQPQPRAGQQLQYQGGQQPQPRAGQQLQYQGGQQPHGVDVSGGNSGAIDSGSSKRDIFFSAQQSIRQ